MRTIHKYVLTEHTNWETTYEGVKFLHVANQHEQITVWAEVNTTERECVRMLYVIGTGHEVPDDAATYLGSVLMAGGDFVFHVYEAAQR